MTELYALRRDRLAAEKDELEKNKATNKVVMSIGSFHHGAHLNVIFF